MTLPRPASLISSCLSRPVLSALLAGTCSLAAYAPQIAAACGAPEPGLVSTLPADGATYPANAALLFDGFDISLDAIKVTVDGEAAQLVPAPFASGFANFAQLLDPQPAPGATVVVSGSFCPDFGCGEVTLTFTAGEPDLIAPAPVPAAGFFGVYDHADFLSSGGDCLSDSDMAFYLHVEQAAPGDGEAPNLIHAAWDPQGNGHISGSRRSSAAETQIVMSAVVSQLDGADPTKDVCFTVSVTDLAGNVAAPYEVCPACYFRKDDAPVTDPPPDEPSWTDADAVPGSACATAEETTGDATTGDSSSGGGTTEDPTTGPGTSTGEPQTSGEPETSGPDTGDQDDDGKGCACDSDGAGGPGGAALAALLLLGARRRRGSKVMS